MELKRVAEGGLTFENITQEDFADIVESRPFNHAVKPKKKRTQQQRYKRHIGSRAYHEA